MVDGTVLSVLGRSNHPWKAKGGVTMFGGKSKLRPKGLVSEKAPCKQAKARVQPASSWKDSLSG